jgi:hypothetical protein
MKAVETSAAFYISGSINLFSLEIILTTTIITTQLTLFTLTYKNKKAR